MRRNPKGLYAKAKAGQLRNFTGIDAPYEGPDHAEVHPLTQDLSADDLAATIMKELSERQIISIS